MLPGTAASCWLAIHSDIDKLCLELGHTRPAMLWKHYHKAVTRKQAEAFWKIEPSKVAGDEVPIAAARNRRCEVGQGCKQAAQVPRT